MSGYPITADMVWLGEEHFVDSWRLNGPRGQVLVTLFRGIELADYLGDGMHHADIVAARVARAWKKKDCAYLNKILIDGPSRGDGHGSKLLEAALDWLDARGCVGVILHVQADRDSTLDDEGLTEWYMRHGFKKIRGSDAMVRRAL